MKHLVLFFTLLTGLLQPVFGQVPHTQNAWEHIPVTPAPNNSEVITFLTYTLIINESKVTRIGGTPSSNDWVKTFYVDGHPFHPRGAVEIGNQIAMVGTVNGGGNFVLTIDYNGNPQWVRSYPNFIDKMIVSINGNLLLATTYLGANHMEYLLAEIDPYNGDVLHHDRVGVPNFVGVNGTVVDIEHNGVWYLAIIKAAGQMVSITSDAGLVPDKVVHHHSPQLSDFDIREIRRSVQGDFYVTGVDTHNDQFFCGKMSINQWFTDMRRVKIQGATYDYELAGSGPISAESPNRLPYYHGGSWGSITVIPGNAAYSFTGRITDPHTGHRKAVLVQYDELWNLNYGVVYDHGVKTNQSNLVKRWTEQLVLVSTIEDGNTTRLIENRLADDFWGCFSQFVLMDEAGLEIINEEMEQTVEVDEFPATSHDLNEFTNSLSSPRLCGFNKTAQEANSEKGLESHQLKAYPNPSNGNFTLSGIEGMQISIYNLQGKLVQSFPSTDLPQMEITALPSGAYMVKAEKGGKIKTLKAVVR